MEEKKKTTPTLCCSSSPTIPLQIRVPRVSLVSSLPYRLADIIIAFRVHKCFACCIFCSSPDPQVSGSCDQCEVVSPPNAIGVIVHGAPTAQLRHKTACTLRHSRLPCRRLAPPYCRRTGTSVQPACSNRCSVRCRSCPCAQ